MMSDKKLNISCHEAFIPFTDVYELGGPEVFKALEGKQGKKNLIIIPMTFSKNLDKSKETSFGAEKTSEELANLHQRSDVQILTEGISRFSYSEGLDIISVDKPVIDTADFSITKLEKIVRESFSIEQQKPVLITTNSHYHFKFSTRGMRVEKPNFLLYGPDVINEGILEGTDRLYAALQQNKGALDLRQARDILKRELYPNQFITFMNRDYARVTGDLIRNRERTRIITLDRPKLVLLDQKEKSRKLKIGSKVQEDLLRLKPRNMEQYLALQYGLLNPDVELFFICGGAGSGKTILSYIAAADQVLNYPKAEREQRDYHRVSEKGGRYRNMVLLKPFEIMGGKKRDVGFLPGNLYEKISGQLKSYEDAHNYSDLKCIPFEEMFLHPTQNKRFGKTRSLSKDLIIRGGRLPKDEEAIELTYSGEIRGRSLDDRILLVDEAQNFTPYEMKTICARAAEGTKVIVMGDPYDQIDNPLCTSEINGLTHAIIEFLHQPYSALIGLTQLHRSQLAEDAAKWKTYQ